MGLKSWTGLIKGVSGNNLRKDTSMMRLNFYKVLSLVILLVMMNIFVSARCLWANGLYKTTEELIEIAQKIKDIEKLSLAGDITSIGHLRSFLKDKEPRIKAIAIEKLIDLGDKQSVESLKVMEKADPAWFVRSSSRVGRYFIPFKNMPDNEMRKNLKELFNTKPALRNKVIHSFIEKGWEQDLDELISQYPQFQLHAEDWKKRNRLKKELKSLPNKARQTKAIRLLQEWKTVDEYREAVIVLIEIGNNVIPDILKLLEENIPTSNPPPFYKEHTIYSILLDILKSIPDNRSEQMLENLSINKIGFVQKEANMALKWVKSGVPFPYKYMEILMISEDDVPPDAPPYEGGR